MRRIWTLVGEKALPFPIVRGWQLEHGETVQVIEVSARKEIKWQRRLRKPLRRNRSNKFVSAAWKDTLGSGRRCLKQAVQGSVVPQGLTRFNSERQAGIKPGTRQ